METETGQPLSEGDADTQADTADEQADLLRAVAEAALAAEDFDLAAEYLARLRALQSASSTLDEGEQDPVAAREVPADDQAPEPAEQPVAQVDTDEPSRVEKAIDDHPRAEAEHEAPSTTDVPEAGSEAPAQTIMDAPNMTHETPQQAERIDTASETARLTAAPEVEPAPEDTGLATEYPARARALPPDTPDVAVEQRRPAAAPWEPTEERAPVTGWSIRDSFRRTRTTYNPVTRHPYKSNGMKQRRSRQMPMRQRPRQITKRIRTRGRDKRPANCRPGSRH